MIIDGRAVAADILRAVRHEVLLRQSAPRLTVFTCAPNFETQKFLALKKRRADEVGVALRIIELPADSNQSDIIQSIKAVHQDADGIIVQLPFPPSINIETVLSAIEPAHDVDAINGHNSSAQMLSPVVGAIAELSHRYQVDFQNKRVVIIGQGRLVGAPATRYAESQGAQVTIITKENAADTAAATKTADIIITGAGVPNLIKPAMISDGVVIFDAGTSEDGGELVGDVEPNCAGKAALLTPVPGGIGPITVAVLLRNVLYAAQQND